MEFRHRYRKLPITLAERSDRPLTPELSEVNIEYNSNIGDNVNWDSLRVELHSLLWHSITLDKLSVLALECADHKDLMAHTKLSQMILGYKLNYAREYQGSWC